MAPWCSSAWTHPKDLQRGRRAELNAWAVASSGPIRRTAPILAIARDSRRKLRMPDLVAADVKTGVNSALQLVGKARRREGGN